MHSSVSASYTYFTGCSAQETVDSDNDKMYS